MAEQAAAGGGSAGEDLITIVDVTDPDEPSYADFKTRRRPLTAVQLASLRPMLQKVGAYQFFSRDLGFADAPAVKQFVDSLELEEFKPTKTYRIVQSQFKGTVAGREVVIDAGLVEKTFGLVDDGENISKPRGDDVSGLHAFYIKPHYVEQCQNHRGVNLAHVRGEYSYFENMVHQIQTYCCGVPEDGFMKLTQYRALDLIVRGKPVNWNRYLLQNFQERIRKYKKSPCSLYFAGTLTALIYAALNVDYSMVIKVEQKQVVVATPPPLSPKRTPRSAAGSSKRGRRRSSSSSTSRRGRKRGLSPIVKAETSPRSTRASARRAAATLAKDGLEDGSAKRLKLAGESSDSEEDEEPEHMETDTEDVDKELEAASSGGGLSRRQASLLEKKDPSLDIPEVLIGANKTYRLSTLFNQAMGNPITKSPVPLTDSKDLWKKYAAYYTLGQECHLEHIISKQSLEESLRKVKELEHELEAKDKELSERLEKLRELEAAAKDKDEKLGILEEELQSLTRNAEDREGPLKIRFKKRGHGEENGAAEGCVQGSSSEEEPVQKEMELLAHDSEQRAEQMMSMEQTTTTIQQTTTSFAQTTTTMLAVGENGADAMKKAVAHGEMEANGSAAAEETKEQEETEDAVAGNVGEDIHQADRAMDNDRIAEVSVKATDAEVGTGDRDIDNPVQQDGNISGDGGPPKIDLEMELAKKDQLIAALMLRLQALEDREKQREPGSIGA